MMMLHFDKRQVMFACVFACPFACEIFGVHVAGNGLGMRVEEPLIALACLMPCVQGAQVFEITKVL